MPDYSKSKLYTIRCRTDDTLIYVGSTLNPLYKRWGDHKSRGNNINGKHYNLYVYETIRDNGGFDNFFIELHESYPCENKEELRKKEGEIIRLIGTLNSQIAGRTIKEWCKNNTDYVKERNKIYNEEHKEEIKLQRSEHYKDNRLELLKKKKIYSDQHKEEINQRAKIYRDQHKEETKQYQKIYIEEHKEEIKQKYKQYYEEHKEEIKEKKKIYCQENKEEIKEKKKIYREEHKEEIKEKAKLKYNCICGSSIQHAEKTRHNKSKKHLKFINK